MRTRVTHLVIMLLVFGALAGFFLLSFAPAIAASPVSRYVAPGGNCGGASPCYASIQAAVDAAADGDVIKVAQGPYTGVQTKISATTGYTYTQVVLIDSKSLTLKGGYTTDNWNIYDPQSNPTIIDAQHYGRGVTILGDSSQEVTVAGFQIVNGDYTNLGNPKGVGNAACPSSGGDCAGGLLAYRVKLNLQDALIRNNTASRLRKYSHAGGILLWQTSDSRIENTRVFSNTSITEGYCGGAEAHYTLGGITITHSQFEQNHSTFDGGGLCLDSVRGPTVIEDSRFVGNSAVGRNDAVGGAIDALVEGTLTLNRVELRDNRASRDGAAIQIESVGLQTTTAWLVNVLVAGNSLQSPRTYGSAVNIHGNADIEAHLQHVTVAHNQTPGGIRVSQYSSAPPAITVNITNTLVTSATYGLIGAHYGNMMIINHTHTLFHNVAHQTVAEDGSPTFNATGTVTGDPKLDGNQRLQAGSAAIDAGVDGGVHLDLDGGIRPSGAGYDIGADEYNATAPGALRFAQATYAVKEGENVVVTIERVGGTAGTVSVHYASSDGTATAGNDYTVVSGTFDFANGETSKTFTLHTLQDTVYEADETFVLSLSNPTGGATLDSPHQAVVTIQDDDVAAAGEIHFLRNNYIVREDEGTATITVVRSGGSSGAVSVHYTTGDGTAKAGSDYTATSGVLNFGNGETSKSFAVPITQDSIEEWDETVNLVLTNVSGGARLGTPNQAMLIITEKYTLHLPLSLRNH